MTDYPPSSSYPPPSSPNPYTSGPPSPGNPHSAGHPSFPFPAQPSTPQPPANFPDSSSLSSYYSPPTGQTPQPARKSRSRLVLTVVAVVMFVAAGVLAGLYIAADSEHEKVTTTLEERKAELGALTEQIAAAEKEKSAAEQANTDLETQNDALLPCVEATQHYLWDGLEGAEREAAIDAMFAACGG